MPATPEQLFAYFDSLGIAHSTVHHPPMFTVADGRAWHNKIPGLHCKNLFMQDRKDRIWLAVLPGDKRANANTLQQRIGSARLSFGKPDLLLEVLGVTPGAVTPFALINDTARRVTVVLDRDMMASQTINFHPLRNDASTTIATADLMKFITALGYAPLIVDCG
jgi:Ala-tRNA(Pro) deacylase